MIDEPLSVREGFIIKCSLCGRLLPSGLFKDRAGLCKLCRGE